MCSINFIYHKNNKKLDLSNSITNMVDASKHRGPDSTERTVGDSFAFGFNRLEIVGGELGKQPIFDKKNNLYLICNGEIFNYLELKDKYFAETNFITTSDVEIILHLYKKFGVNFLKYLEGQFAFLLFDIRKGKILMGRDKFGINPLFYYHHNTNFLVSSEIKSILATKLTKDITLDAEGIADSLLFYGAIPPKTCFSGINQLPPASYGIYDIKMNSFVYRRYWDITPSDIKITDLSDAKAELSKILTRSVKKRLQGESHPGVYLSGGLDSSLIGVLAHKNSKKKTKFFSIAFKDSRYDESFYQNLLAQQLGAEIYKVDIDFSTIAKNIRECVFHIENPLIRSAPIPMMLLSKSAKKAGIKFVLCGEGADEMFAGYPVFAKGQASFENKWDIVSPFLNLFKDRNIIVYADRQYSQMKNTFHDSDYLTRNRKKEIITKLSQYLLVNQGDRVSMANGVEQRFPFLDTELVEFAFRLDESLLIQNGEGKNVLKKTFIQLLPKKIVLRKKQGYLAPDDTVIRKVIGMKEYSRFFEETYFVKVNLFSFPKVKKLINKAASDEALSEFEANILLFIFTTHLLYNLFLEDL